MKNLESISSNYSKEKREKREVLGLFAKALETANILLRSVKEEKEDDFRKDLIEETKIAITEVFEPALHNDELLYDTVSIFHRLANQYDYFPATDLAGLALDVFYRNLSAMESRFGKDKFFDRLFLKMAHLLVVSGNTDQGIVGQEILQSKFDEIFKYTNSDEELIGKMIESAIYGQYNPEKDSSEYEQKLTEYLWKQDNNFMIAYCLLSNNKRMRDIGEGVLSEIIEQYGLPAKKTIDAWVASSEKLTSSLEWAIDNNFETLENIERQRPGIAHFLNEKFNIFDFGRYPENLLIRQYDEYENLEKPYGVVLFPEADRNSTFYSKKAILRNLFEQLEEKFAIRVCEGKDKLDIARLLHKLDRKYGKGHKISFAVIGGHGTKNSIRFGGANDERYILRTSDLKDPRADRKSYFENNPTIILSSCSTGFEDGISQEMSRVLNAEVIAPKQKTSLKEIGVELGENNQLHFDVKYRDEGVETRYSSGEKDAK